MYYASLDAVDPGLPVEFSLVRELRDPARPNIKFALITMAHSTKYLPKMVVIAPKSGFDVKLRSADDAVLVYAFVPSANESQECSLKDLWEQGVKDWGVVTLTLEKAKQYQVVA